MRSTSTTLVLAGLKLAPHGSPLSWMEREFTEEDEREAYERGEPWGPRAVELAQQRRRELTTETAGRVGQMLWAENVRSVNHRYDEQEWEEVYQFDPQTFLAMGKVDPVKVLGALRCYEYQACEHPEWKRSEAHAFVEALTYACIRALPGYGEAPWEVTSLEEIRHVGDLPIEVRRARRS